MKRLVRTAAERRSLLLPICLAALLLLYRFAPLPTAGAAGHTAAFATIVGASSLVRSAAPGATPNVTVNAGTTFQTIDGFGVNANSAAWNQGDLKSCVDQLIDLQGTNTWR